MTHESAAIVIRAKNSIAGASFGGGPVGAVTARMIAAATINNGTVAAQARIASSRLRRATRRSNKNVASAVRPKTTSEATNRNGTSLQDEAIGIGTSRRGQQKLTRAADAYNCAQANARWRAPAHHGAGEAEGVYLDDHSYR
jgi:hypothetical protein